MSVFKLCMQTQQTKAPTNRFPVIAWFRSQSDSVAQLFILSDKSANGCRVAEWIDKLCNII